MARRVAQSAAREPPLAQLLYRSAAREPLWCCLDGKADPKWAAGAGVGPQCGEMATLVLVQCLAQSAARGRLVDTEALIQALRRGNLYAAIDVTDPEPLPSGHPLWQAPNLMITPHVAGAVASWKARAYRFTRDQLLRYVNGQPLLNRVQ